MDIYVSRNFKTLQQIKLKIGNAFLMLVSEWDTIEWVLDYPATPISQLSTSLVQWSILSCSIFRELGGYKEIT